MEVKRLFTLAVLWLALMPSYAKAPETRQASAHHASFRLIQTPEEATAHYNELLNLFYNNKKQHPDLAEAALRKAIELYPKRLRAYEELGYWLIGQKRQKDALHIFNRVQLLTPHDDKVRLQRAYLYLEVGDRKKALQLLHALKTSKDLQVRLQVKKQLHAMQPAAPISKDKQLLNRYFRLKKTVPEQAFRLLQRIARLFPKNVMAHKELGYQYLNRGDKVNALHHFTMAQRYERNNHTLALQRAYLLFELKHYKEAYHQFVFASYSPKYDEFMKAKNALIASTNRYLALFKHPWFLDIGFTPYYLSRFKDYIFPADIYLGRYLDSNDQLFIYMHMRYTRDTRTFGGLIPQIFEDNAWLTWLGISVKPFKRLPIFIYAEGGAGYDLIDRNRPRWRPDFRAGVSSYFEWGAKSVFSPKVVWPWRAVGNFYGNIAYYSRYGNTIGQLRLRQGFRVMRWRYLHLDLYGFAEMFFDTKHLYFNNILEAGPGIAFTPYNPIHFIIRYEYAFGEYLPVGSPAANPFRRYYQTSFILFEFYKRI